MADAGVPAATIEPSSVENAVRNGPEEQPSILPAINSANIDSFYEADVKEIPPQAKKILLEYSKIPEDEVRDHVVRIRNEAWAVHKYPCIGRLYFLQFSIAMSPVYLEMLHRIKSGALFLDVGCCVGQEVRQLVHDGAPSENLYGSDIQQAFLDIGYKLFRDKDTLKSHFFAADIFEPENAGWREIRRKIDIIWAGAFLHLFGWQGQVYALRRMMALLKDEKDVLIAGRNLGHIKPGPVAHAHTPHRTMYRHDEESFKKLWAAATQGNGTEWEVKVQSSKLGAAIGAVGTCAWATEDTLLLRFQCRRI